MQINQTALDGCCIVSTKPYIDERGTWTRFFCTNELKEVIGDRQIVNVNHSLTKTAGTVRGMHYQNQPFAEMKLIRCIRGKIFDVAVDLRKDSPTFLRWFGTILSAESMDMIIIPEGLAHGFQALENDVEMIYLHTEFYSSDHEGGVLHNDPIIGIDWPLPPHSLSLRDLNHPRITSSFNGIDYC